MEKEFMLRAIRLADENIDAGGGPFGAVIVKDGAVVAESANRVIQTNDPTAHAEVMAIRKASEALGDYDLSGCTIYSSCEPCPMCLGAIYWSHLDRVYYAADQQDAAKIGFDDAYIYRELDKPIDGRNLKLVQLEQEAARSVFHKWDLLENKPSY